MTTIERDLDVPTLLRPRLVAAARAAGLHSLAEAAEISRNCYPELVRELNKLGTEYDARPMFRAALEGLVPHADVIVDQLRRLRCLRPLEGSERSPEPEVADYGHSIGVSLSPRAVDSLEGIFEGGRAARLVKATLEAGRPRHKALIERINQAGLLPQATTIGAMQIELAAIAMDRLSALIGLQLDMKRALGRVLMQTSYCSAMGAILTGQGSLEDEPILNLWAKGFVPLGVDGEDFVLMYPGG